ncbi:annexin A7, partial [Aplysia californica]|uniref:Annexin A7 n=1 Tax=Aplysia californica TaxID=6500 RepID=A0ABM0ZZQ2_APLCA
MAEKETAPPSYDQANPGQSNTGYAPPTGDPSGNPAQPDPYGYNPYPQQGGYLPQGGYPMQPAGQPYPPQYGMQGQNNTTVVTHQPMMTTQQVVHQVPDQMSLAIFAT